MGYVSDLILGIVGNLIAAELYVHADPIARWIVSRSVTRLPADERERRLEEWLADLNDRPGLGKLAWALGCVWTASTTHAGVWRAGRQRNAQRNKGHDVLTAAPLTVAPPVLGAPALPSPMKFDLYLAALRQRRSQLEADRAVITERGIRMRSRWGSQPFVDTTKSWLAELDRRINELSAIIRTLEQT